VLAKKYEGAQKYQGEIPDKTPNINHRRRAVSALASGDSRGTVRKARFIFRATGAKQTAARAPHQLLQKLAESVV
jgi:hypothetical protein